MAPSSIISITFDHTSFQQYSEAFFVGCGSASLKFTEMDPIVANVSQLRLQGIRLNALS